MIVSAKVEVIHIYQFKKKRKKQRNKESNLILLLHIIRQTEILYIFELINGNKANYLHYIS